MPNVVVRRLSKVPLAAVVLLLAACETPPPKPAAPAPSAATPAPFVLGGPAPQRPSTTIASASTPPSKTTATAPAASPSTPATAASQTSPRIDTPALGGSVAGQSRSFSTQLATYTSVAFGAVPGWTQDEFSETWPAFIGSCKVLTNRGAQWKDVCAKAARVDGRSTAAIRAFFEGDFAAYQIRDDDRRADGVVTGYFEPEIPGSRTYAPPFIYPVYGQPEDMLFVDVRTLPAGNGVVAARIVGRNVVVQTGLNTRDLGSPGLYALDLSAVTRDSLDRKLRLRVSGRSLLPYFTREEIETKGAPNAPVLAFVSSATALYEMQIQGSGRIKLPTGETVQVGYAEQNGQPFRPMLAKNAAGKPISPVRTRGGAVELELDDGPDDGDTDTSLVRTRGFTLAQPATSGAVMVPGQRMAGAVVGSGITDPSYVFFKVAGGAGGTNQGPVGAFGVALQPGRSIAVDPRSTPLGYPVFVSTRTPDSGAPMQRLTIAQDTGGAIRGAVRADYFFGNGQAAATSARRMKEPGQLWVLLPRGMAVAQSSTTSLRTRGGAAGGNLPQCLVPDDQSCADD